MPIIEISSVSDFKDKLNTYPECIIKFSAHWCGPCKTMDKVIYGLKTNKFILLIDIDLEDMQDYIAELGLKFRTIPAVFKYKQGNFTKIECNSENFAEKCLGN